MTPGIDPRRTPKQLVLQSGHRQRNILYNAMRDAWNVRCEAVKWSSGEQCKRRAQVGCLRCHRHGGKGVVYGPSALRAALLKLLCPWAAVPTNIFRSTDITDVADALAYELASAIMDPARDHPIPSSTRFAAVEFVLSLAGGKKVDADTPLLLTHLSYDDASTALDILRANGYVRT